MYQRKYIDEQTVNGRNSLSLTTTSNANANADTNGTPKEHSFGSQSPFSTSERTRKRRILTLANNTKTSRPQLLVLCLGIAIGIWGLVGTWMVVEIRKEIQKQPMKIRGTGMTSVIGTMPLEGLDENNKNKTDKRKTKTIFQRVSEEAPECYELESPDEITLTLVTQVSHDRLWMMRHHCDRYKFLEKGQQQQQHRMSIAVYSNATREEILEELKEMGCGVIISESDDTADSNDKAGVEISVLDARTHGAWNDYPVNELRYLALSRVSTTHILYLDVDFWPCDFLYETLMGCQEEDTLTPVREALFADPKQALVIPAFQLWRRCSEWIDCREENIPNMETARTLKGLAYEIQNHKGISVFDPTNLGGHGSTNYKAWFSQPPGSVLPIECLQSNRYEPFVMVRYCKDLPPFQKAFAGYGKNKVTWMMNLVAAGYIFSQVGGTYLIHYPHLDSSSRQHWNNPSVDNNNNNNNNKHATDSSINSNSNSNSNSYKDKTNYRSLDSKRSRVDQLFVDFRDWLVETIPATERRLELCNDAQNDDGKLWVDHSKLQVSSFKRRRKKKVSQQELD